MACVRLAIVLRVSGMSTVPVHADSSEDPDGDSPIDEGK